MKLILQSKHFYTPTHVDVVLARKLSRINFVTRTLVVALPIMKKLSMWRSMSRPTTQLSSLMEIPQSRSKILMATWVILLVKAKVQRLTRVIVWTRSALKCLIAQMLKTERLEERLLSD